MCAAALVAGSFALAAPGEAATSTQLAFRAERDGNAEIYVASSDGSRQADLSNAPGSEELDPAWSPDGNSIAFARHSTALGGTHILVMKSGGCCLRRLTSLPTIIDRQPAWSPDGTKLAFTRGDEDTGAFQIWVIGADGSNLHAVTGVTAHVFNGSPAWSPDGTRIAFVSDRAGGFPKIFVMNADGTFAHALSGGTWADGNPAWSPDGAVLAFDRCCPGGHSGIYLMPSSGGPVTRVTGDAIEASDPPWSPDGTTLAFVGFPPGGGNRDIYTIHTDGSGVTRVTTDPFADLTPAWNPSLTALSSAGLSLPPPLGTGSSSTPLRVRPVEATGRTTTPSVNTTTAHHKKRRKKKKHLKPITKKTTRIAPGLTLTRIVNRKIPQRIFILRAHVLTTGLTADVALAQDQLPGFETVRSMAGRHHAIAAVNGDYGMSSGRPMNIFAEDGDLKETMFGWGNNISISQDEQKEFIGHPVQQVTATVPDTGETWQVQRVNEGVKPLFGEISEYTKAGGSLFRPPSNSCGAHLSPSGPSHLDTDHRSIVRDFEVTAAGCFAKPIPLNGGVVLSGYPTDDQALMLRALVPGQTVRLTWTIGWHESLDALGGFPRLLHDGRVVAHDCARSFCGRNPRTGVGFTKDGTMLMVVVDGRRDRYSRGASLVGFARMMKRFGAVDALNLDGGGSSTMVVKGKVINRPSDPGGPRHVSSALLILRGPDPGEAGFETTSTNVTTGLGFPPLGPPPLRHATELLAWRLAARDPGSTGGLVDALAHGAIRVPGFRMTPVLAAALRLYRR